MKKITVAVLVLVLAALIGGGIARASIPNPVGTIHGCYKTSNPAQGALIAIDSAASCPSGYTALNWQQDSLAGLIQVTSSVPLSFAAGGTNGTGATCPTGWPVATGGGAEPTDFSAPLVLIMTTPVNNSQYPFGWQAAWRNTSQNVVETSVTIHIVCGRVAT